METVELKNYIQGYFEKNINGAVITPRIIESFAGAVENMISSGKVEDSVMGVKKLLSLDFSREFVMHRQPEVSPVPNDVIKSIEEYVGKEHPNVIVLSVSRSSNHPDDEYLYSVIGMRNVGGNAEYVCWTSWNQSTGSLNYGHYGIPDYDGAFAIIKDNFHDSTGDMDKYGPERTLADIPFDFSIQKEHEEVKQENEVPAFKHRRGAR